MIFDNKNKNTPKVEEWDYFDKADFVSKAFYNLGGKTFNPSEFITKSLINKRNNTELYIAENKKTKKLYAIKSFEKSYIHSFRQKRDLLMEKYAMQKITPCPYITEYYGSAQNTCLYYLLQEYVEGGDLWKKAVIYGLCCENLIKYYFIQILKGIKHLHSLNIIHRDIKPENVLISGKGKIAKITDFGSSLDLNGTEFEKLLEEIKTKENLSQKNFANFVGTPNYMAPECIHNKKSDKCSDIWSLGCLLYFLFTGFPPFLGKTDFNIFQKADDAKFIFPEGFVPPLAQDLIQKCIVIDSDKRLTIDQILEHPYLSNEVKNNKFLESIPEMNEKEKEYYSILLELKNKFEKYKIISKNLDIIKLYEEVEESDENNELNENIEEVKKLIEKKGEFEKEYEKGFNEFTKEIEKRKKLFEGNSQNIINKKLEFLEIQLRHELFRKIYYGIDYEPKFDDDEESNSDNNSNSSHED